MRQQLTDILKQTTPLFKKIKISGSETTTTVQGHDDDKMVFVTATMKEPIAAFQSEFGLSNLAMLSGLLNHPSYKTDEAKLLVHQSSFGDYVGELEFRDKQHGFVKFRTINPRMVEQPSVIDIPFILTIAPTKASIAEFTQLAGLLADVDSMFGVRIEQRTLFLTIGSHTETTHTASIPFATEVEATIKSVPTLYITKHFLTILKNAGSQPSQIHFSNVGIAGVSFETEYGIYTYYLRGKPV